MRAEFFENSDCYKKQWTNWVMHGSEIDNFATQRLSWVHQKKNTEAGLGLYCAEAK